MIINCFIALSILGIIIRRSKVVTFLIFAFIWILMWCDTLPDYYNYDIGYNTSTSRDLGYGLLCTVFSKFGIDYLTFKLIISIFALYSYYRFITKYAYYNCLVAALYLLFLSQLDIEQFRNFLAFSVFLYAVPFLFYDDAKSKFRYILIVFLSASIHMSMVFYLVFVFINKTNLRSLRKMGSTIIIVGIISAILLSFVNVNEADRMEMYSQTTSSLTKFMVLLMFGINYLIVRFYYKREKNENNKSSRNYICRLDRNQLLFVNNKPNAILYISVAIFFIIPLVFGSLNFLRLYRFLAVLYFIYISNIIRGKAYLYDPLLLFIYASSFIAVVLSMHGDAFLFRVLPAIFYNNLLFPGF